MNFKNIFDICTCHIDKALNTVVDLLDTTGQHGNSETVAARALAPIAATYRTQTPQNSPAFR